MLKKIIIFIITSVTLLILLFLSRSYLEKLYFKPQKEIKTEKEISKTIIIESPKANDVIDSPLIIKGKAKGNWFFEATFPVTLVDWDGKIITESYVEAKDNWMTEDFVTFEGKLEFKNPSFPNTDINHFSHRGTLIFRNSNPSGLLENQYYFELPIRFK